MKSKIMYTVIIVLSIAGVFWGKARFSANSLAEAAYRFTQVEARDMVNSVSATGTLSALVTVEVGSEVSGSIKELLADFNTPVKKDQVIARIDPESYETLVRQAQAELEVSQAKLETARTQILRYEAELANAEANWTAAKANTKKAQATAQNARLSLRRQQALVAQDFVSRNDFDLAKTSFEEAAAQLEQSQAEETAAESQIKASRAVLAIAKASVKEAEAEVKLKQAALDKCNVDLSNTIIRSPVDGVVIDRSVDVGQTVAASLSAPTLFTIAQDLHKMQVSTSVDEADIGRIKEGQKARFSVDAFGTRKFAGKVAQVRKLGTTVQNVVTYEVIISADNGDLDLLPGMTADVEIELLKKPQVLTVANSALRFTPPEGAAAGAGHGPPPGTARAAGAPVGGRGPDPAQRVKSYAEQLGLSASQQAEMVKIFQQMGQKMMAARGAPPGPPGGGAGAQRDKVRKATRTAIARILSADQLERYEALEAERQSKRGTLWRQDAKGRLLAMAVTLGTSDATHTEISGPGIEAGLQVIGGLE
jgi:HlyD family secretion protein